MGQQEEKHVEKEEHFLWRGNSMCKGPEARTSWLCSKTKEDHRVAGWCDREVQGGETREVGGGGPCRVTGKGVGFTLRAMGATDGLGAEGTWKVNCKKDHELIPGILHH